MPQSFSRVQNRILSKLKNARSLRYADLQPDDIPNDLFNYHLQFLVKKGFVEKHDEGYALGRPGIKHVADPDIANEDEKIASTFKINVITLISRKTDAKNSGGIEILNQIRTSHPSFGKIGAMGGIVRKDINRRKFLPRQVRRFGLSASSITSAIDSRVFYSYGSHA